MVRLTTSARIRVLLSVFLISVLFTYEARSQNGQEALVTAIDTLMNSQFKPQEPGAAVIVVKDGKVIFRKGYGLANVELNVAVEPDMIFRIGSITKQFTAVAILMLEEQGKLSVKDDLTKYFPDYPTQGKKITVEHLLTHTSGIKSYTSLPEWLPQWRKDFKVDELVALFKDKPMDFAPGDGWNYNNSAYFLLGAIIEKASGQSYADFVEKNIFAPLGMKHSFYDNTERVIARRVAGYSKKGNDFVNCAYLSMTQPYAAGSLISSVDDLALWDAALYTDKIVKQETLKRAWTPAKLNDGRMSRYGYGWGINEYQGHRMISHGGGINGFITHARRLPDDKVFVSVLTNRDTGNPNPDELTMKIAALVIGKPFKEPVAISLPEKTLDQYVGTYQISEKEKVTVRREGAKLVLTINNNNVQITPTSESEFFFRNARFTFTKDASGGVKSLILHNNTGVDREAKKVSE